MTKPTDAMIKYALDELDGSDFEAIRNHSATLRAALSATPDGADPWEGNPAREGMSENWGDFATDGRKQGLEEAGFRLGPIPCDVGCPFDAVGTPHSSSCRGTIGRKAIRKAGEA